MSQRRSVSKQKQRPAQAQLAQAAIQFEASSSPALPLGAMLLAGSMSAFAQAAPETQAAPPAAPASATPGGAQPAASS